MKNHANQAREHQNPGQKENQARLGLVLFFFGSISAEM